MKNKLDVGCIFLSFKKGVILVLGLFLISCSKPSGDSHILIKLPDFKGSSQNSLFKKSVSAFSTAEPTVIEDINCFAITVSGPEPEFSGSKCLDPNGNVLLKAGMFHGGVPSGGTIELDVPSGSSRNIKVWGFKAADSSSCSDFQVKPSQLNYLSSPYVISSTTIDLEPGTTTVDMYASFDSTKKVNTCSGDVFSFYNQISIGKCSYPNGWQNGAILSAQSNYMYYRKKAYAPDGTLYMLVEREDANYYYGVGVYKSTDNGASWIVDFDYQYSTNVSTYPQDMIVDGQNNVFVVSSYYIDSAQHWIVHKYSKSTNTWSLVDEVSSASSGGSYYPYEIMLNPLGEIVVRGSYYDSAVSQDSIIFRKSADGGNTWTNTIVSSPNSNYVYYRKQVSDLNGHMYMLVEKQNATSNYETGVFKSTDGGSTWSLVYEFQYNTVSTYPQDIIVDSQNNLYVVSSAYLNSEQHWLTQKYTKSTNSWSLVDDLFVSNSIGNYYPYELGITTSDDIIVRGSYYDSANSQTSMIFRKSSDGGMTWTNAALVGSASSHIYYRKRATGPDGTMYILAEKSNTNSYYGTAVFKSTDNGSSWVLDYEHNYTSNSEYPEDIKVDAQGNVFVISSAYPNSEQHWLTHMYSKTTNTWSLSDDLWAPNSEGNYYPYELSMTPSGNVLVRGSFYDATTSKSSILFRVLTCN